MIDVCLCDCNCTAYIIHYMANIDHRTAYIYQKTPCIDECTAFSDKYAAKFKHQPPRGR